jgi:hypothetical protein
MVFVVGGRRSDERARGLVFVLLPRGESCAQESLGARDLAMRGTKAVGGSVFVFVLNGRKGATEALGKKTVSLFLEAAAPVLQGRARAVKPSRRGCHA